MSDLKQFIQAFIRPSNKYGLGTCNMLVILRHWEYSANHAIKILALRDFHFTGADRPKERKKIKML